MQRFRLGVSRSNCSVFVVILAAAFALTWTAQAVENITVTPASVKKSVTPGAAGLGLCYLLDSDINRPRNVSTLQAVTEMGCKVLRFPYGHLADNYLWTIPPYNDAVNGLQPHIASSSQTPGSWNWATSGSGAHKDDMDFDEFMDICANAGSESLVVVNVLSHKYSNGPTYQELKTCAVEWVRYAKDNNLNVGYWQIGNEVDHHDDILTLTEYKNQYVDFVTAMKAVDPTIKTGPGILNAATYYDAMLYDPICLNLIDFISAHEYQWAEYTYAQWRDLSKVVMNSVERVQRKVDGSNKPNLEIHITETSSFPGESGNRENNTMNALLWFELLMDELSTQDVKYTYNWCSRSPWDGENGDGGLANALDNDTNSARKPTGEIIKIVNDNLHDRLVDAEKASGYVRTYATLSSTNDALTVFLMNRNTSSVDVNVDTAGYAPSSYDRWEFKGSTPTDSAPTYANTGTAVLQTNGFTTTLQPLSLTVMKLETTAAPTPDPLTWASVPAAVGDNQITMTATTASDPSGVEYFFDETSDNAGGDDSGWQDSPTYTDNGLSAETTYSYRVRARDKSANTNETDWTSTEPATTLAMDNGPPSTPGFDVVPTALSSTEITMTAETVVDPEGSWVEYFFTETSGNPGGDDSDWQDSTTYIDGGLDPSTAYSYTVTARDKSAQQNQSGISAALGATTEDAPSGPGTAIIYEPFNYDAGSFVGVAVNGTGLTGDWGGFSWPGKAATVGAGSLSYGTLPTSFANKVPFIGGDNARANIVAGTFDLGGGDTLLDDGDTLWFSVLINPNANGANNTLTSDIRDFAFALSTANLKQTADTPLQSTAGSAIGFTLEGGSGLAATTWSSSGGTRNPSYATPPVLNTAAEQGGTYLIVGEMIFGATDTINIYMPGTDLSLGSVIATQTTALDQSGFNKLTFAGTDGMNCGIDEIRFGATYEDVIGQEPIVGDIGDVDMVVSGSALGFSWYGEAGQSYGLEMTEDLVSGSWDIVTNVAGTNGIISLTDEMDKTNAFYRVFLGE